jgi:hypothetical protein
MGRIDIQESQGSDSHKSPSPVRKVDKEPKTDSPLNSDSGYFEGPEDQEGALQSEPSIEIIFDKNASNNNSGKSGEGNSTGRCFLVVFSAEQALRTRCVSLSL